VRVPGRWCALAIAIAAAPLALAARDEGWLIERMNIRLDIRPDGVVDVLDAVDVDFRGLEKHGIYRDVRHLTNFDEASLRVYDIDLTSVTDAAGRRHDVKELSEDNKVRFRIGDPDRTISGKETYRIAYTLGGALNGFPDHDELYWNATGEWPVAMASTTVVVHGPKGSIEDATCYQGYEGSTERCQSTFTADEARFSATRRLEENEQLTIVTRLKKGAVTEPMPHLRARPRTAAQFFDTTPAMLGGSIAGLAAACAGMAGLWWKVGRDRRFRSIEHLSQEGAEERVPLLGAPPVGVEFEPPDRLRPGQMGVLLDESADTLDVTATIVDLAVRGYLTITEIPKSWIFGSVDWQVDRTGKSAIDLLPYERIVLDGLFKGGTTRKLSDLKNKFYKDLESAKTSLYGDAVERGWFPRSPRSVRTGVRVLGIVVILGGVVTTIGLGQRWGAGLLGVPIVFLGLMLAVFAGAMPRRTAKGRALLQRTLGFVKYVRTAEVGQQTFAERANLFTAYLPYAIVFKCVRKWARAFEDIDVQSATAGWYVGSGRFDAGAFSSNLSSFSSSVSSTIASTPGGSGSSGFSGGSSGGGGGGGGGGSW
jgi:uncharacterized protein (TIGR04222 family)